VKFIKTLADQVSMSAKQPNEVFNVLSRASNRVFEHKYYVDKSEAVKE
jgi:saccharopine dehydrogenase-like NADP-dependent oxidoreductase